MLTSTAWFPEVVIAMLEELPPDLRRAGELGRWCSTIEAGRTPEEDWDVIQGVVNRTVRLLPPERTRGYFRDVDHRLEAYLEPWTMGESRFMANGASRSVQHRRACHPPWRPGTPNGHLLKRWPAEELPPPAAL